MRLAFVLPGNDDTPYGGYRVAYEYANRLVDRGHAVSIVFPAVRRLGQPERRIAASILRALWGVVGEPDTAVTWFDLRPEVTLVRPAALGRGLIGSFDAVVATAWDTAEDVLRLLPRATAGAYLIQHDEGWSGPASRVIATWSGRLTRIVIAQWLGDLAQERGSAPVRHIPNAIDTELFQMLTPPAEREPFSVCMLWHELPFKASILGLDALKLAHGLEPRLTASFFGYGSTPKGLPEWVTYHQLPSRAQLVALLNRSGIMLSPSRAEGWALPPAEAMACGTALVATDIGGHRDYARDGINALLVPVDDMRAMADALIRLMRDPGLRTRLGQTAAATIASEFSWEASVTAFENVLVEAVSATACNDDAEDVESGVPTRDPALPRDPREQPFRIHDATFEPPKPTHRTSPGC